MLFLSFLLIHKKLVNAEDQLHQLYYFFLEIHLTVQNSFFIGIWRLWHECKHSLNRSLLWKIIHQAFVENKCIPIQVILWWLLMLSWCTHKALLPENSTCAGGPFPLSTICMNTMGIYRRKQISKNKVIFQLKI